MKKAALALAVLSAVATAPVLAQSSRDYISIVGSSTVYPFATVVAEQFGKATKFKTPKIESTGSGGGIKLFCAGVGVQHPDITNASRAIKKSELEQCAANGVKEVVEVKIGYDGLSIAQSKAGKEMQLTRKEVFLALAKQVPNPDGTQTLVDNPYKTWKDVNAALPAIKIEVLGPPPTSGTRDAFVELVMDEGCDSFDFIKAMKKADKKAHKAACQTVREDGGYVEAGENDNLIVQKLEANPAALGIFGFSFLDQNRDKVRGLAIEGVQPEFETISNGSYPVSRPLFFYVKKAHVEVIPGMKEYLAEFISKKAMGDEGYLAERGLIPLPKDEYMSVSKGVTALDAMK
ncbi:PstS family phosphate ABC transporter substrate-binding protein [Denitromonas ohlonensis]|uniref:PstS family phosphate ABC transporter substrate-binding protein n=2 Tax=Denitromonas TaxID=139331 RepID=A0A557SQD0_9RHOO|nr:PstS family phosphate ABC transporter substrate-binding protein [Denitromonas ohlonensis]TVO66015.1 PstS family phosphate ABC transporter substrate-binding protein [Denitromonas ohlonensis]TVO79608.1 PstS family phosphate ABC transporter substrate-binding protein [Denitromonas ohlonensis]TVT50519.1 MAG: PstS family phosphate ABC transporter substrate-binding protein [Denitromonas halophila]TVT72878.1 MAG: PstS family phosphate ABC transporter substrate-binding protein [Denitromonas halophila